MIRAVSTFLIAAVLSHYLTPVLRQAAIRFGIVDRPDGKLKKQQEPVPYLGGIAIYLSFLLALALTLEFHREVLGILLAGAIVVLLGLIDDLGALGPGVKLAGQVVAVLTLMKASIVIKLAFLPVWVALVLSFVWLLAVTNAFNLIDVMDGLAAGVGLISAPSWSAWRWETAGRWWPTCWRRWREPPRIPALQRRAGADLHGRHRQPVRRTDAGRPGHEQRLHPAKLVASLAPVVILGLPIFDMLFVMYIRWPRGAAILRGSPDHFALRLRNWRLTTRQTVWASYAVSALLGAVGVAMMLVETPPRSPSCR